MPKKELEPVYNPQGLQEKWYPLWESEGYFDYHKNTGKADASLKPEESFSIVIPPPNVTGSLHLGHALNHTLQDILIRHARMQGKAALWVPGTDHAGIATQNVVERLLAKDGVRREDLGREKFEERVWQWKAESGGMITHQMRQLGESVDWSMERFTMDEGLSYIVRRVFVQLYKEGLIYRGERMINWCPKDQTALSNIEVEHREINGNLYYVRYPLAGGALHEGKPYVIVATTRPETILGDEALAVHPDDERYTHLKRAQAKVPFLDKLIPIIFDAAVDKEFGTGVVKITPAHDFNDFATGQRHNLPLTNVMTDSAQMNELAGPYAGLSREACRKRIVTDLESAEMIEKIEPHKHSVGHSYRSGAIVEPRLSLQWFVKIRPLADKATEAVKSGATEFYPKRWENLFFDWMDKIEDWCISRQLWWGHQIPAWYCIGNDHCKLECKEPIIAMEKPEKCPHCGSANLTQDKDVLDTWFSSALWPFSTLMPRDIKEIGEMWPLGHASPQSKMLDNFYPTSVLVTGFDIIFFWVSRMLMMGTHFMKKTPFEKVIIHSLVRDANRQKMSKSKGNVVNPLEKMDEYGTDAFRFFLISIMPDGKDIIYDEARLKGYQSFCNKIWNTARFILMNTHEGYALPQSAPKLSAIDAYILDELDRAIEKCDKALADFHFADYALAIYDFLWKTFCDQYIELSKVSLKDESLKAGALYTLHTVFAAALKLLHPAMPFITEELNSFLPGSAKGLMIVAKWPVAAESQLLNNNHTGLLLEIASKLRQVRAELSVEPGAKITAYVVVADAKAANFLREHQTYLASLARLGEIKFTQPTQKTIRGDLREGIEIYLDLAGAIDIEREKLRLEKEAATLEKGKAASAAKLASPQFAERAPAELVEAEKAKLADYNTRLDRVRAMLSSLS
ncbi:MAG: valine--tRNA ligase [Spirochaetes bacterium]|nr:valine--tRNA ligase [Spirochaetota bacterium]